MRLKFLLSLIPVVMVIVSNEIIYAQSTPENADSCHVEMALIFDIQFSSDGKYVIANWPPHSVRVWNAETGATVATFTDDRIDFLEKFAISPDNKYVVTGGNSGTAILWDVISGEKVEVLAHEESTPEPEVSWNKILNVTFSPDSNYISILAVNSGSLWRVDQTTKAFDFPSTHNGEPSIRFSPNSTKLIIEDRIWDVYTGELLHEFDRLNDLRFSPDGKFIAAHNIDNTILIDANTYQPIHTFPVRTSELQFSQDAKYLLASKDLQPNEAGTIYVWNVATGEQIRDFSAATPLGYITIASLLNNATVFLVKSYSVSPNPRTVFSILDVESGAELREITIEMSLTQIQSFAIAPNEQYFVTGSHAGYLSTVTLWDSQTGNQIRKYC